MKYFESFTVRVRQKLSNLLSDQFDLTFDAWSTVDTHYVGIVASYSDNNENGYSTVILGLHHCISGEPISREALHILTKILEFHGKTVEKVTALIGDNWQPTDHCRDCLTVGSSAVPATVSN